MTDQDARLKRAELKKRIMEINDDDDDDESGEENSGSEKAPAQTPAVKGKKQPKDTKKGAP